MSIFIRSTLCFFFEIVEKLKNEDTDKAKLANIYFNSTKILLAINAINAINARSGKLDLVVLLIVEFDFR